MMEVDLIKLYLFKSNADINLLDKFSPPLKNYSKEYLMKTNEQYINKFPEIEQEQFLENIKEMKTRDPKVYKLLLSYFN